MTGPVATRTLVATLDEVARANAFTAVYEGYGRPFTISPAQMTAHVRNNDVALERSPLWLDGDGRLIGLGLVGLRGRQAWIGGLGIVPAWRGRGLARPLIEACLDNARAAGASGVELEVLVGNDRAKRSYERVDFRETGRLIGVRGEIPAGAASARVIGAARLLERPLRATCWQRARPSLARIAELEAVWLDHALLLFTRADDAITICHLAAEEPTTTATLLATTGARTASLVNEPQDSLALATLLALKFQPFVEQHQMRIALGGGGTCPV